VGLPILQMDMPAYCRNLQRFAEENNWQLICNLEATPEVFKYIRMLSCDGVIARIISDQMRREARRNSVPIVNCSAWIDNSGVPTVRTDNEAVGRLSAEYLLKKGFLRLGAVQMHGGWFNKARTDAFLQCFRGREVTKIVMHSRSLNQADLKRFKQWIAAIEPPFACFLSDQNNAQILINTCLSIGLRVPQDVAFLAGSGRLDDKTYPFKPSLSHIDLDLSKVVLTAAEKLDRLMNRKAGVSKMTEITPKGIVAMESTDIIPVEDPIIASVVEYLCANYSCDLNLKEYINNINIPRRTFDRRFRMEVGMSPREFIVLKRCKKAILLLKAKPRLSFTQIVKTCGFVDLRQMRHLIKKHCGLVIKTSVNRRVQKK